MSDGSGLVDFAIGLVNSVLNLPDRQVKYFEEFTSQKDCKSILLIQKFWRVVEMTFGLVNTRFCKNDFLSVSLHQFPKNGLFLFLRVRKFI